MKSKIGEAKPTFQEAILDYKMRLRSEGIWLKEVEKR